MLLFDKYQAQKGKYKISPHLLWEYNLANFDWEKSRRIVVQRVVERGCPADYFAAFDLYGFDGFREILKDLPILSDKDMNFASKYFNIPKKELRCYTRKQSRMKRLNS